MQKKINCNDKFFIAGSTGMVGSSLARSLLKHNYVKSNNQNNLLTPKRSELNLLNNNTK